MIEAPSPPELPRNPAPRLTIGSRDLHRIVHGEPIIANGREEAKQVYEQLIEQVEAGKYNELIEKHLESIAERKRKDVEDV